MLVRERPCCKIKPSKYIYDIDYDQGKNLEENIKKLKCLSDNLKEEIKVNNFFNIF
jgi:hypothetical protein